MTSDQGHAVVMRGYGPPDVLVYTPVTLAPLAGDEIRIRTIAAAINHTDLEIRAGNWPIRKPDPFPYVPGVEAVGDIVEVGSAVSSLRPGDRVITVMQGLGGVRADRPGGYATHVTVAADAAAPLPRDVDPFAIAAFGLGGVTAFEGLRRIGPLAGRRILVTGAAGGVGSAGVALARAQGALVTGVISRPDQADYVRRLGAEEVVAAQDGAPAALGAESIDGILDTVGAATFGPALAALKPGGVLSLVGAVSGGAVSLDLWDLIRPITLTGYSTEALDGASLRGAVRAIVDLVRQPGAIVPDWTSMPLPDAARAHALLEGRGISGRVLLVP